MVSRYEILPPILVILSRSTHYLSSSVLDECIENFLVKCLHIYCSISQWASGNDIPFICCHNLHELNWEKGNDFQIDQMYFSKFTDYKIRLILPCRVIHVMKTMQIQNPNQLYLLETDKRNACHVLIFHLSIHASKIIIIPPVFAVPGVLTMFK